MPLKIPLVASRLRKLLESLGPGLVTGAADDDPSGIATYSQAGAQFGYGLLWTMPLTLPLMIAVQLISARIGRVTGQGIVANLVEFVPRWLVFVFVGGLLLANFINIAADIAAMGEALQLIVGGYEHGHALLFGVVAIGMQVLMPYRRYAQALKWLALSLLSYIAAAFAVHIDWSQVAWSSIWPKSPGGTGYFVAIAGISGTTISPYLFFWQASQEAEEMSLAGATPLREAENSGRSDLRGATTDTIIGMVFSNVVAFFIIVSAAATLNQHGITDIANSADAARALRPIAGDFAFLLFALAIIGAGLLAVPVLAGSAAYAVAELFGWRASLAAEPRDARGFYGIIGLATLAGVLIDFTPIDPVKMLYFSAILNNVTAAPLIVALMLVATRKKAMRHYRLPWLLQLGGWTTAIIMALISLSLLWPL